MPDSKLQLDFSRQHADAVFNRELRRKKAAKVLAILADHLGPLNKLTALDIGCSAGNNTVWYSRQFSHVTGVDVDTVAVQFARQENSADNISYGVMSGQHLAFPPNNFDVIICVHVYEHVPDASELLREIGRVLKPGGVCYFSAGNRLQLIEPHYRLPLLSIVPKFFANWYLRLLRRGRFYYETHLTCWGLRKLVSNFQVIDYTIRTIAEPERFEATDMVAPGSLKQRIAIAILRAAYWVCPTYLWILRKPPNHHVDQAGPG